MEHNEINLTSGVAELLRVGAGQAEIRHIDGTPIAIVPSGYSAINLGKNLAAPTRIKGTTVLFDDASFIAYVNKQKGDATELYYETVPSKFVAVINSDRPDAPGWGDHRAVYECPISKEWAIWTASDGQKMDQESFSRFIENNLPDIIEPESAQMLEIVTTLEAKKNVNFASGIRLSDGSNQFTYEEDVQGSAAKGTMQIPEIIKLGLPVFENGDRYGIDARFRYRIQGGKLSMWYELVRPHKVVEDAVNRVHKKIEQETGLSALNGIPKKDA